MLLSVALALGRLFFSASLTISAPNTFTSTPAWHRSYYKFAIGTTIFAINCVCVSVFLATFYRVYMGPSILCVHWMSYVTKKKRVHTQVWRWLGLVDEEKKGFISRLAKESETEEDEEKEDPMNVVQCYTHIHYGFILPFLSPFPPHTHSFLGGGRSAMVRIMLGKHSYTYVRLRTNDIYFYFTKCNTKYQKVAHGSCKCDGYSMNIERSYKIITII